MMPHAEPYVARSVRATIEHLDSPASARARTFVAEELQHQAEHRRFNRLVLTEQPGLNRLDRLMSWTFAKLDRRSLEFNAGFAAGFETIAYAVARWVESRLGSLFRGADDDAATLFLWHLAEEVGHKSVAFDAFTQISGKRRTYVAAMVTAMVLLGFFAAVGTFQMLWHQRRLFRPIAHWRMLSWTLSFLFELLPAMVVSALPGHHPTKLVDPPFYGQWLEHFDADNGTLPIWSSEPATASTSGV
jgi:predicted metal-dependent hydrolase